jgi:hypothetical protein
VSDLSAKSSALSVISAVEEGDVEKFDAAFKAVDEEAAGLLERFLVEVATGKYEVFTKNDGPLFHRNPTFARAVLRAWHRVSSSRAKIGARMAFETVIADRRRNK